MARFDTDWLTKHQPPQGAWTWEGTFADYLIKVQQTPSIADLAHARIYRMIMSHGVEKLEGQEVPRYKFFSQDIFGIDDTINEIVEYFSAAARGMDIRRRILLMMGSPGTGKSTITAILKKGLEEYSRTDEGALYAISFCPQQEEPLHLLPEAARREFMQETGVTIEGDLCPYCQWMIDHEYQGRLQEVPVKRVLISESRRIGIGTFAPSDSKVQDISELVGSMDLSTISRYGSESDPRAYRFDGAFNAANRGIMEFIEMLKAQPDFLHGLLTLAQERKIKVGRFGLFDADEAIIAHTNENEFERFVSNKAYEALHNRVLLIKVPYNLTVSQEIRTYQKMMNLGGQKLGKHIAPNTLKVAAMFGVGTRLARDAKFSIKEKLTLYDGKELPDVQQREINRVRELARKQGEGFQGISPRHILDALSYAMASDKEPCVTPTAMLRAIRESFEQHITQVKNQELLESLKATHELYDEAAKNEIQRAFVDSFQDAAQLLYDNYLEHAEARIMHSTVKDPVTGEEVEPNEKILQDLEKALGISDAAATAFRQEMVNKAGAMARRGQSLSWDSHPKMKEAIEKKLFADVANLVKVTTSTKVLNDQQKNRVMEVKRRLIDDMGYCEHCAQELLDYVGYLLTK
ncbi:PrkA family serine protein kinase [Sulfobacillus thermosulfidooxidans]|uniref:PrkA family serine protein kinase n=1 Tax=Sulfobacillus thermosulfidooxidans TaxID=28034 RepID=UPI00041229D8|nr:protein PrkA [Sulfobacillus thermosulfidooxidans]